MTKIRPKIYAVVLDLSKYTRNIIFVAQNYSNVKLTGVDGEQANPHKSQTDAKVKSILTLTQAEKMALSMNTIVT